VLEEFLDHIMNPPNASPPDIGLASSSSSPRWSEDDIAAFHGAILRLVKVDAILALELASNVHLPPLNGTVAMACVRTMTIEESSLDDVRQFASRFVAKDQQVISSQTVATALALRVRKVMWNLPDSPDKSDRRSRLSSFLLQLAVDFRVDPSQVFSTNALAIQRWAVQCTGACRTPQERAEKLLTRIERDCLLLKSSSSDACGILCMSDIERLWLNAGLSASTRDGCQLFDTAHQVWRKETRTMVLSDPKRWLVDARMLREYADLLRVGDIRCTDSSFSAFLEECGECHRNEQPRTLEFELTLPEATDISLGEQWRNLLSDLAPHCSYWATLLTHLFSERVKVEPLPSYGAHEFRYRVLVSLPEDHECLSAAKGVALPEVLFEDDHLLVLDKPPSIPTSRHALCQRQKGDP
jgi:hypothetical protein